MLTVYSVLMCFHHMCNLPKSVSANCDRQFIIAINLIKLLFPKEFLFFLLQKEILQMLTQHLNVKPNRKEWASADTETHSSSPAVISPFGSGWSLCFLHVLVIVKHNNGFYKSQFTSLVMWIIQPEWQREGESAAPLRWVLHLRWEATEDGILSELFICFPSTFSHPFLYSPSLSTVPPSHTGVHTHIANSHFYFMQR